MSAFIITRDDITREEIQSLWDQDICMDDWDYIVLAPIETITLEEVADDWDGSKKKVFNQDEYVYERLLTGCSDNIWHDGVFRGKRYAIGVAYHA